jgi:hypothetical protein
MQFYLLCFWGGIANSVIDVIIKLKAIIIVDNMGAMKKQQ